MGKKIPTCTLNWTSPHLKYLELFINNVGDNFEVDQPTG